MAVEESLTDDDDSNSKALEEEHDAHYDSAVEGGDQHGGESLDKETHSESKLRVEPTKYNIT